MFASRIAAVASRAARRFRTGWAVALACLLAASAQAQFRIFYWDSFEKNAGLLPPSLMHTNSGGTDTTQILDFASGGVPPGIMSGIAETECGRYGLRFSPKFQDKLGVTGLVHREFLSRDRLGRDGCALVQADIYLPPKGVNMGNAALVAQQLDPANPRSLRCYRFGLKSNGSNKVYFSFTNGGDAPAVYHQAELSDQTLKRPGWHRFQMIFYGQDKIYCAVDTKFAAFSPVAEGTLTRLSPGITISSDPKAGTHGPVYCDNLSIQWTPVATPDLPESPWVRAVPVQRTGKLLIEADSSVGWHSNTKSAWAESQKTGKPVLVLFYIPNLPAYKYLSATCPNDDAAKAFFARFVPLRIDVNQLGGGQMAERFGVTRVPMFMVMNTDGRAGTKVLVENGRTAWNDIVATLGK